MLKIFRNKSELAIYFCEELLKISDEKEKLFVALSGGSTPKIIFDALAKDYKEKINWSKIHLYWSDERCVPTDDAESNYGMTKKHLLDFVNIPEENVHRIKGESEPEFEAKRYSEEIKETVRLINELPRFDLVMLGIGEDGHTASIFPDQRHLLNSNKICDVAVHPLNGQKRITLTGKVINNSRIVIFLLTDRSKSDILRKVYQENKKIYPAEFINPVNGELNYLVDEEAASLLNKN
jgi:6-phosphogluconolactonase